MAFSLTVSSCLSGVDFASIATLVHILEHDTLSHHQKDHHGLGTESRDSSVAGFKITHRHSGDSHGDGDSHQHTVKLGASLVAVFIESIDLDSASLEPNRYIPSYAADRLPGPDLDALYRPPKC